MAGTVTVIPRGQSIETPAEDRARARAAFVRTRVLARRLDRTARPPAHTVWAGHDAGALDTDPTSPYDDRQPVRFTRRGRFVYECLIGPGTAAEVVVR